ncbi:MAG TPA: hypothetical protein VFB13_10800 [Reyranella sp.]|nr:hypothetical protein [Reyranella sp.]
MHLDASRQNKGFVLKYLLMIAPLSLANVFTVLIAVTCLTTMSGQSRGSVIKLWRLAVPAALAVVTSLVLLAGVFDATFPHDAEWLIAAAVGSVVGRARGWTMQLAVDHTRDLVRLQRSFDGTMAAAGMVALSFIDFTGATLEDAIVPCDITAAVSALFAGYIACRSLAIAVRAGRAPHVELMDAQRVNTTSPI